MKAKIIFHNITDEDGVEQKTVWCEGETREALAADIAEKAYGILCPDNVAADSERKPQGEGAHDDGSIDSDEGTNVVPGIQP